MGLVASRELRIGCWNGGRSVTENIHPRFGGTWTEDKLKVVEKYLKAYLTALQRTGFSKIYIDGFAGSGYIKHPEGDGSEGVQNSFFDALRIPGAKSFIEGSAVRALQLKPGFDRYIFVEKGRRRSEFLQDLVTKPEFKGAKTTILQGDANEEIIKICKYDRWASQRAVLFLDPYGLQVEWETLEAIAETQAIDLWLLFPVSGVNRLLKKDSNIPEEWKQCVNLILGNADWEEKLYNIETTPDLFGGQENRTKGGLDALGSFFNDRLKSIFGGVAENPGVLRNSTGSPLFLLCFAVGNARGKDIALRIANHLLRDLKN